MNRKTKNIIYWSAVALLVLIFICGFILGCIKTIAGAGTQIYIDTFKFLKNLGFNGSDAFGWSIASCLLSSIILAYMFFKKFNSRIN